MTPDCEKYEPLLLDELYEELDEVTSAAVKRHVAGCARCSSILSGMRSTRRAATLPLLEMPAGLEDRILALATSHAREAQKVVPFQSRAQRALSWAGNWAMRPQTAMAAVFLLMIGMSAAFIRARHTDRSAEQTISVTEKGQPAAPDVTPGDHDSLDNKAAAAAHGANTPATLPPVATAAPSALALNDGERESAGPVDAITGGKGRARGGDDQGVIANGLSAGDPNVSTKDAPTDKRGATKNEQQADGERKKLRATNLDQGATNAGAVAGAPAAPQPAPATPGGGDVYPPAAQAIAPNKAPAVSDAYAAGVTAYRSRNFTEAAKQFDLAAATGDPTSALWAARSVRDGSGCAAALPRYGSVATKASGSYAGNEALLEAARCQISLGQYDDARTKLTALSSVPSHATAAQQALAELNQTAARREAARKAPAATTTPPAQKSDKTSDPAY